MAEAETDLHKGLKSRHMTMIAIGGVIGSGFFLGAGAAIAVAGPAVILAYVVGGILSFCVLTLLVEMAIGRPVAGSFQRYATEVFGPLAGFLTGWGYFFGFLLGIASESVAAGTFLHVWFQTIPIWGFALLVAILMTLVNVISVALFGEVEFWLSLLKVVALALFIVWGCVGIFGVQSIQTVSVGNLTQFHGFAPAGIAGIFGAMLIVMFAYGGTEAIGTAAEESENAARDMPKVLKNTLVRIVVLFVLSIAVLVTVLPWNKAGTLTSPFVSAVGVLGGPIPAAIMNFVVLTAALSCIDSGLYATSRMLYGMARDGYFPSWVSYLHPKSRTPTVAIVIACAVMYVGALLYALAPKFAYLWLISLSGFGFQFAWLMIALSHAGMRKRLLSEDKLKWRVPGARVMEVVAVVLIIGTFAGQLVMPGGYVTLAVGILWLLVATAYYFAFARHGLAWGRAEGPSRP